MPLDIFFHRSSPAQEVAALATPACMSNHIQESPMTLAFPSSQIHSITSSCFLRDVSQVDLFMQSHLCHPVQSAIIPPGMLALPASSFPFLPPQTQGHELSTPSGQPAAAHTQRPEAAPGKRQARGSKWPEPRAGGVRAAELRMAGQALELNWRAVRS